MLFKKLLTIIAVIAVFKVVCMAGDLTQADINNAMQAAEEIKSKIDIDAITNPAAAEAANEAAQEFYSTEAQERINAESQRLKETIFADVLKENPEIKDPKNLINDNGNIYVFISSSIPTHTLRNFAADIDQLAAENVIMVMRGFVGGMKFFKPTQEFLSEIIKKDPTCDLTTIKCEVFDISFQIHPELFQQMQIEKVPAIAYERPGLNENEIYLVHGDISLTGALERIQESANSTYLADAINKLKGGFYDYN